MIRPFTLRVLSSAGDEETKFDLADSAQASAAQELFDSLKAQGHVAFTPGTENEVVNKIPQSGDEVIMVPQIVAG